MLHSIDERFVAAPLVIHECPFFLVCFFLSLCAHARRPTHLAVGEEKRNCEAANRTHRRRIHPSRSIAREPKQFIKEKGEWESTPYIHKYTHTDRLTNTRVHAHMHTERKRNRRAELAPSPFPVCFLPVLADRHLTTVLYNYTLPNPLLLNPTDFRLICFVHAMSALPVHQLIHRACAATQKTKKEGGAEL